MSQIKLLLLGDLELKDEFIDSVIPNHKEQKTYLGHAAFGIGCFDTYKINGIEFLFVSPNQSFHKLFEKMKTMLFEDVSLVIYFANSKNRQKPKDFNLEGDMEHIRQYSPNGAIQIVLVNEAITEYEDIEVQLNSSFSMVKLIKFQEFKGLDKELALKIVRHSIQIVTDSK